MHKEITLKEAYGIINEYPDQGDFVNKHLQGYLVGGEHDDNSLDTSYYWRQCRDIVDTDIANKTVETFTIKSFLFDLWLWKCGMIEKKEFSRKNHDSLKRTEWSKEFEYDFRKRIQMHNLNIDESIFQEFIQFQKNRLIMAVYRYGKLNNETKPHYDYISSIDRYFTKYYNSGNAEYLVDATNYCLLEYTERGIDNKIDILNTFGGELYTDIAEIKNAMDILMDVYRKTKNKWYLIEMSTYLYHAYLNKLHSNHHFEGCDNTELHAKLKL